MIVLEYQFDQRVVDAARRAKICTIDAAILEERFFEMPVRLNTEGCELLEYPAMGQERIWLGGAAGLVEAHQAAVPIPWLRLPLLLVTATGLATVQEAGNNGVSTLRLPGGGDLQLSVFGEEVTVHSLANNQLGRGRYDELVGVVEAFARSVRQMLKRELPEFVAHPYWGQWLEI